MQKEYTVYIVHCSDGSYYTGLTSNIQRRLFQHTSGIYIRSYIYTRRPVVLVYTAVFTDVYDAISWERRLKRWSKAKNEALIRHDWQTISDEAKRRKRFKIIDTMQSRFRVKWKRSSLRDVCFADSSG